MAINKQEQQSRIESALPSLKIDTTATSYFQAGRRGSQGLA